MNINQVHSSHPVFDIEAEIVRTGNVPSPVPLADWQKRIDKVAGVTPTGQSRVRVVWGQQRTTLICGEQRMVYPFYRVEAEGGRIHDIGTPRFYVEELHELPELRRGDRWEKARWHRDEATGELLDVLGPCPEDGFYTCIFVVAHHDHLCCNGEGHVKYEPCLGSYREPNESDIERVQRAIWNRNHADVQENAPSDSLIYKRQSDYIAKRDETRKQTFRERMADWTRAHAIGWDTLDPVEKQHGKYHWLSGHSKSGLTQEQINSIRNNIRAIGADNSN